MTRVRFAIAATLVAALTAAAAPVGAQTMETYGWWWKVQQSPLLRFPPPPQVPSDGLYVAGDGTADGMAIAALRFDGPPGDATLQLAVATGTSATGASILACPGPGTWSGDRAGLWSQRPLAQCAQASVLGSVIAGGAAVDWDLGPEFEDGQTWDIVLVPTGQAPFQVSFQAPDSASLDVYGSSSSEDISEPEAFSDEELFGDTFSGGGGTFSDGGGFGATGDAISPSPGLRETEPVASVPRAVRAAARAFDRTGRIILVALLIGLLATMGWLANQPDRVPRLLGALSSAGKRADVTPPPGGIGRFSRPRTGPPRRL